MLTRLGLTLHPEKTRLVNLKDGQGTFTFLGCTIRKKRSIQRNPRMYFVQRWPSPRATKRLRDRIRELTDSRRAGVKDVPTMIAALNPVLRGWGNYFRTGNAEHECNKMDSFVWHRIQKWLRRRGGQSASAQGRRWPESRLHEMGLHRLKGTVRYPANATPPRPSVSRVRENRTHGLTGVSQKQAGFRPELR